MRLLRGSVATIICWLVVNGLWIAVAQTPLSIIRTKTEAIVEHDLITLADVAEIEAEDPEITARLAAISLGYAPDVNNIRELNQEKISLAIAAAGFPLHSIKIYGSPLTIIKRAAQIITPEYLRQVAEETLLYEMRAMGASAQIVRMDLPARIEVPAGEVMVRVSMGNVRDLFAPFIASLEIYVDGRIVQRLSVTTQIAAFAPVLTITRDLVKGERLQSSDVALKSQRLLRPLATYLRDFKALRGMATRRALSRGEALSKEVLFAEIVMKPGDAVRIINQVGKLYVEVAGEACAAGRVGDRIAVKNTLSGILLQATIEDEGVVRVHSATLDR